MAFPVGNQEARELEGRYPSYVPRPKTHIRKEGGLCQEESNCRKKQITQGFVFLLHMQMLT